VKAHLARRAELSHDVDRVEQLAQPLGIAHAGWRFRVVLGEVERLGQQERVQPRRRAGGLIAGLDVDERLFVFREPELIEEIVRLESGADDALAKIGDGLGGDADPRLVVRREEERTKERTVYALSESELPRPHGRRERGGEPRRQLFAGAKQRVPVADGVHRGTPEIRPTPALP